MCFLLEAEQLMKSESDEGKGKEGKALSCPQAQLRHNKSLPIVKMQGCLDTCM
jgi:hypothetical protein